MRVYLIKSNDAGEVVRAKEEIRSLFELGNHSIHITDTRDEAVEMGELLFNQNSIHFLNRARPKNFRNFLCRLESLENAVDEERIDRSSIVIDSGSVLAAYGIREAEDLDILHTSRLDSFQIREFAVVDSHNSDSHYSESIDDLIMNPSNHFYYLGFKFVSIDRVREMKEKRAFAKDRQDLSLIRPYLERRLVAASIAKARYKLAKSRVAVRKKLKRMLPSILLNVYRKLRDSVKSLRN